MTRLVWTEGAIADLEHIRRYVAAFQRDAARRLARRIDETASALTTDAMTEADSVFERLIVYPYTIRSRAVDDTIIVMAVRHNERALIV